MELHTLRDKLTEWTDWDGAAFLLAQNIGLIPPDVRFNLKAKHVFWSDNPIGNALHNMLRELVAAGVLENRNEPDGQYRWNTAFVGSWEAPRKHADSDDVV